MLRHVTRRVLMLIPMLLLISLVPFVLTAFIPGDPAREFLGENASPQAVAALRQQLHLDDPIPVRYVRWLGSALQGDLGRSIFNSDPVVKSISARLPVTIALVSAAVIMAVLVAVPLGLSAGARRGSLFDRTLTLVAGAGVALPEFWLGLILIVVFALKLRLLPPSGFVDLSANPGEFFRHLALPALTLASPMIAELFRQTRASVLDVFEQDFVRTARAGGIGARAVLLKHVAKNAMIPVVTVLGLQVGRLVGVAAITERVFGLQGVGFLAITSALNADLPTIAGIVLLTGGLVLLVNLVVDLSYFYFNPRLRFA
jgi:peptide/nickel transport system permease protein